MKKSLVLNKMPHWESYEVGVSVEKRAKAKIFAETVLRKKAAFYSTPMSKTNVENYLVGSYGNLYGTILGYRKNMQKSDPQAFNFSFFLYYSHETGRIERFLVNEQTNTKSISFGELKNTSLSSGEAPIIIEDEESIDYDETIENYQDSFKKTVMQNYPLNLLDFRYLNDGKMDKKFYDTFIIELFRDYWYKNTSFKLGEMKYIKQLTLPIEKNKSSDNFQLLVGSSDLDTKKIDSMYFLYKDKYNKSEFEKFFKHHFQCFNAPKFIDYERSKHTSSDKLLYLNIPKNFNWKVHRSILNTQYLGTATIPQAKLPKSLRDLKSYINSRTVVNKIDLYQKVMEFNKNSFINLMNLYTNGNYRPDMIIDRHFSIKMDIPTTSKNFTIPNKIEPETFNTSRDGSI
uniref:Uncharacterized protein n=1 Tax=Coniophora olivacea TaxID=85977 RepID=A0A896Z1P1_9AGAM